MRAGQRCNSEYTFHVAQRNALQRFSLCDIGLNRKSVFRFVVHFPLSVGFEALLFRLFVVVCFHRAGLLALRELVGC